jgi:nitrogen regulatory protein PII
VKLVIGIVRPEKANDVLEALYRAEVRGISMSKVQGHGGELDKVETYRGSTVAVEVSDKVRFEIAVTDPFVEPTIPRSARAPAPARWATGRSSSSRSSGPSESGPARPMRPP